MLVDVFVRGASFEFVATFSDVDGNPIEPATVKLYVSYLDAAGDRVREELTMEQDTDGTWLAEWDSSAAKKCRVAWSIRTTEPPSAKDGIFDLAANLANPDPEEST